MTNREFYVAVANGTINDEIIAKANDLIAKHDASNEKRKSSDTKEKREVRARVDAVKAFLVEHIGEQFTRDAIAEACGITVGQAQSAALTLYGDGIVKRDSVKVDKAKRTVYSITE